MPSALNINPGDRFGSLVALTEIERRYRHRHWLFRCECGADVERALSAVLNTMRRGSTPACRSCSNAAHSRYMHDSGAGPRAVVRVFGEHGRMMLEPVDIDRDLDAWR
jgi:hypothetical protein